MLWKIALLVPAGLCIFDVWLEEAGIQYLIVHIEPSRELKALDIVADNVIKKEKYRFSVYCCSAAENIN